MGRARVHLCISFNETDEMVQWFEQAGALGCLPEGAGVRLISDKDNELFFGVHVPQPVEPPSNLVHIDDIRARKASVR